MLITVLCGCNSGHSSGKTEEMYKNYVPELGDQTLTLLEEAMNVLSLSYVEKMDEESIGWILDDWLMYGFHYGSPRPYAGLTMVSGTGPSPIDESFSGISIGDECRYYGIRTKELEAAIRGYYGIKYKIPKGKMHYDTCINDGKNIVEWEDSFRTAYEPVWYKVEIIDAKNVEGVLYLTTKHTKEYHGFPSYSYYLMVFMPNPDSMFDYTLKEYKELDPPPQPQPTVTPTPTPISNLPYQSDFYMTYEDAVKEEERIRNLVNSGEATKVEVEAGENGFDWARWYVFEDNRIIFAYYYNSETGAPDQRMYFYYGNMFEWIEGNGNDDSSRTRHYICDDPLDERWYAMEASVVSTSRAYKK